LKPSDKIIPFSSDSAITNQEIDRYIKEISDNLICSSKTKKRFLKEFRCNVNEYVQTNRVQQFDDVIKHFGTPSEIAKEFFVPENYCDIKPVIKFRHTVFKLLLGLAAVILSLVLLFLGLSFVDVHKNSKGYYSTRVEQLTDSSYTITTLESQEQHQSIQAEPLAIHRIISKDVSF